MIDKTETQSAGPPAGSYFKRRPAPVFCGKPPFGGRRPWREGGPAWSAVPDHEHQDHEPDQADHATHGGDAAAFHAGEVHRGGGPGRGELRGGGRLLRPRFAVPELT